MTFERYLRTGRRCGPIETKFNPWHDPENRRFTFAGQGRHSGSGTGKASDRDGSAGRVRPNSPDPTNPRNHSTYVVKRGDTLSGIAGTRVGLTAADLGWLNGHPIDKPLRLGQRIKVPHQNFLDEGRRARDSFIALAHYMDLTGGKLPPNPARPPSIPSQIEAAGRREFSVNGYRYEIDRLLRTRRASGDIRLRAESRSRSAQTNAGKPDRRNTDDGGHFIAARFGGPREWFNHFAQDANFNRGAYRALEEQWAKAVRAGKRVFVDIVPYYRGTSMRPWGLLVTSITDGEKRVKDFPNEAKGQGHAG